MKRRNFLKTVGVTLAGLFGLKVASPGKAKASDDYWIPYHPANGKGRVRIIYNHGPHVAVAEYDSDAENLQDVPREALENHPYVFDVQLKQDGKTVYQWMCEPTQNRYENKEKHLAITEWVWKERCFSKNGMSGPWVTSFFKDDPLERRVFYVDVPEGKAEKLLTALKKQFAKKKVA